MPIVITDADAKGTPSGYLVSLFARSLAMKDYCFSTHPDLMTYACGVMASAFTPIQVRTDPWLLRQYPPKPLTNLGGGLIWR